MSTQVRLAVEDWRADVTFTTPDGLNVLSSEALRALYLVLSDLRSRKGVRVIVLRAEGRAFIAGADLKEVRGFHRAAALEYASLGLEVFNLLSALPAVTIAAISGAALGGGLEIAVSCDFRVAVKDARLGLPEVTLGLIPGWGGIGRVTRLVGPARAKLMFLSGRHYAASEAVSFGLVDVLADSTEDLGGQVSAFARMFLRAAPSAIALAKRASRDADDLGAFVDCFDSAEAHEGIAAFLEKRPPKWTENTG
jgi:enoyl-CoA hydratase